MRAWSRSSSVAARIVSAGALSYLDSCLLTRAVICLCSVHEPRTVRLRAWSKMMLQFKSCVCTCTLHVVCEAIASALLAGHRLLSAAMLLPSRDIMQSLPRSLLGCVLFGRSLSLSNGVVEDL
eukprot:5881663-Pleurochrysis_carterae.AAC.6